MARRSDHKREEIKSMAIAAGGEIIKNDGFAALGARKVAREIGYTVGTLYNVFENYDDMVLHINVVTLDKMYQFIVDNGNSTLTGVSAVKELADCYLIFAIENKNLWSALFEYVYPHDKEVPEWYMDKVSGLFRLISKALQEFLGNEEQVDIMAKTIWASIHGICTLGLSSKLFVAGDDITKQMMHSMIDNYMKGVLS